MAIIKASHNEYMRRLYPIINGAVNGILQVSVNRAHMQASPSRTTHDSGLSGGTRLAPAT